MCMNIEMCDYVRTTSMVSMVSWMMYDDMSSKAEVEPAIVACRGARFVDVSMIAWAFASTNQATPALMEEVQ